jgi:hypothetical protein
MSPTPENVEDVSPYSLLRNFSKSRLLRCLFLALLIHAAVIGGLSSRYIYRTWIDPEVALPEQVPASDADDTDAAPEDGTADDAPSNPEDSAAAVKAGASGDADDAPDDAPVVNRVTEKADPDQIPDDPGGLGLSIDDVQE